MSFFFFKLVVMTCHQDFHVRGLDIHLLSAHDLSQRLTASSNMNLHEKTQAEALK